MKRTQGPSMNDTDMKIQDQTISSTVKNQVRYQVEGGVWVDFAGQMRHQIEKQVRNQVGEGIQFPVFTQINVQVKVQVSDQVNEECTRLVNE